MERKVVKSISVKNGMNQVISTIGVLTADEKFVVGALARIAPNPTWSVKENTETGKITKSRTTVRVDVNISTWNGSQGEIIVPYLSCRVTEIEGSFGSMTRFGTPFDNGDDRKQYKNALISDELFDTIQQAMGIAVEKCMDEFEKGGTTSIITNKYLSDSRRLSKIADITMNKAIAVSKTETKKEEITQSETIKNLLLGTTKTQEQEQKQ